MKFMYFALLLSFISLKAQSITNIIVSSNISYDFFQKELSEKTNWNRTTNEIKNLIKKNTQDAISNFYSYMHKKNYSFVKDFLSSIAIEYIFVNNKLSELIIYKDDLSNNQIEDITLKIRTILLNKFGSAKSIRWPKYHPENNYFYDNALWHIPYKTIILHSSEKEKKISIILKFHYYK